jgi:hypothetical protein
MSEPSRWRSALRPHAAPAIRVLGVLLLTVTVTACKGSNPSGPSGTFSRTFTGNITALGVAQHAVNATRSGQMRGVLTWASATADLDLYLTAASCNSYPPGGGCTMLDVADGITGTSETVTRGVTSGEQYKFWVDSFSVVSNDYTLVVTIE